MTFPKLAYETLEKYQVPLSIQQIWEKPEEYGFQSFLKLFGKTLHIKDFCAYLLNLDYFFEKIGVKALT